MNRVVFSSSVLSLLAVRLVEGLRAGSSSSRIRSATTTVHTGFPTDSQESFLSKDQQSKYSSLNEAIRRTASAPVAKQDEAEDNEFQKRWCAKEKAALDSMREDQKRKEAVTAQPITETTQLFPEHPALTFLSWLDDPHITACPYSFAINEHRKPKCTLVEYKVEFGIQDSVAKISAFIRYSDLKDYAEKLDSKMVQDQSGLKEGDDNFSANPFPTRQNGVVEKTYWGLSRYFAGMMSSSPLIESRKKSTENWLNKLSPEHKSAVARAMTQRGDFLNSFSKNLQGQKVEVIGIVQPTGSDNSNQSNKAFLEQEQSLQHAMQRKRSAQLRVVEHLKSVSVGPQRDEEFREKLRQLLRDVLAFTHESKERKIYHEKTPEEHYQSQMEGILKDEQLKRNNPELDLKTYLRPYCNELVGQLVSRSADPIIEGGQSLDSNHQSSKNRFQFHEKCCYGQNRDWIQFHLSDQNQLIDGLLEDLNSNAPRAYALLAMEPRGVALKVHQSLNKDREDSLALYEFTLYDKIKKVLKEYFSLSRCDLFKNDIDDYMDEVGYMKLSGERAEEIYLTQIAKEEASEDKTYAEGPYEKPGDLKDLRSAPGKISVEGLTFQKEGGQDDGKIIPGTQRRFQHLWNDITMQQDESETWVIRDNKKEGVDVRVPHATQGILQEIVQHGGTYWVKVEFESLKGVKVIESEQDNYPGVVYMDPKYLKLIECRDSFITADEDISFTTSDSDMEGLEFEPDSQDIVEEFVSDTEESKDDVTQSADSNQ